MTKKPAPHRTHALDRDGDGAPGGSLPGNQTAPMADELADARTTAGDDADKLDAINRETDEAHAAARAEAGWSRDEARLTRKLDDIGARFSDLSTEAVVQSWTDQEAFMAETFADAMLADGKYVDEEGQDRTAAGDLIALPAILAEWEIGFEHPAQEEQTFDPEQVAAADDASPLERAMDALDTAFADEPDQLGAPELGETDPADRQQVAARIRDLQVLVDAPRLYRSAEGYSSNYGAPYISDVVVRSWIVAGLAEDIPSAGNAGGVKMTADARRMLADLKRGEAA